MFFPWEIKWDTICKHFEDVKVLITVFEKSTES